MRTQRRIRVVTVVIGVASWLVAGCSTGFIQESAQTNLASFVIDVFSTAVNSSVTP